MKRVKIGIESNSNWEIGEIDLVKSICDRSDSTSGMSSKSAICSVWWRDLEMTSINNRKQSSVDRFNIVGFSPYHLHKRGSISLIMSFMALLLLQCRLCK